MGRRGVRVEGGTKGGEVCRDPVALREPGGAESGQAWGRGKTTKAAKSTKTNREMGVAGLENQIQR